MKQPNSYYKQEAKSLMEGKYSVVIPLTLILGFIAGLPSFLSNNFFAPKREINWETLEFILVDPGNPALVYLMSLLTFVLGALIAYSTVRMFILVAQNERPQFEPIIKVGFVEKPIRTLVTAFLSGLYIALWSLLFIIPGIVKTYAYSMSIYLLNKEPELDAADAITKSKDYTMGKKGSLFYLDLSYLGWYILGIFTFGILWFWIIPKHQTAKTLMFNEIYEEKNPKPILIDEEV